MPDPVYKVVEIGGKDVLFGDARSRSVVVQHAAERTSSTKPGDADSASDSLVPGS